MTNSMPTLFIETDIQMDVDDVGALALAMTLERQGRLRIAGVGVNTPSRWGARAVESLKSAYGATFPVGVMRPLTDDVAEKDYARLISAEPASDDEWQNASELFRDVLAAADDASVTVVSIGFYGNLTRFLRADAHADPESAADLIQRKVVSTIVMGGLFPRGREFNFVEDVQTTRTFLASWPTSIRFIGQEVGNDVITGRTLTQALGSDHPLAIAYSAYCGPGNGRPSWDLIAVYLAAFPRWTALTWSPRGEITIRDSDGSNEWTSSAKGCHRYAVLNAAPEAIAEELDRILNLDLAKASAQ